MTKEENIRELEEIQAKKQLEADALTRAEAAETKLAKAERDYEISQMWLKAIEESRKKSEEAKAAEYAKAVEAAEYRRKQNEAERAERLRWENMTPDELEAEKEKCRKQAAELEQQHEQELLKMLGSPKAVAEFKRKQEEEFAILRAERKEMLRKKKAEHEAYLRRIGVIDE